MPVIFSAIKTKLITYLVLNLLLFIGGGFLYTPVSAVPMDIVSVPVSGVLQGSEAGNINSFTTVLAIPEYFASATIASAELKFELGGISSGTVAIYDQYMFSTVADTAPLAVLNLTETGAKTLNFSTKAQDWQRNSETNLGLFWRSVNLSPEDSIAINNIGMTLDLVFPDTLKPLLVSGPEAQKIAGNKYRITANFDEPVSSKLEYGKTIQYGITDNIDAYGAELKYDLENLQSGVSYHYRLIASDAFGNKTITQDYSFVPVFGVTTTPESTNVYSLDLKLAPPQKVVADFDRTSGEVKVSWQASLNADISGYRVLRRLVDQEEYQELDQVGANTVVYYDTNTTAEAKYFYQVRAFSGLRESAGATTDEVIAGTKDNYLPELIKKSDPLVVGILAVSGLGLVLYALIKLVKSFRAWLEPPKKKKSLENIFRDPDSVW